MMFPCLGIFLLVIAVVAFGTHRAQKQQKQMFDRFWEKEHAANQTRRQDISHLAYVTLPLERFPLNRYEPEIFASYEEKLCALSQTKMLNLHGQSNTDLKLAYGLANLDTLLECEKNFDQLCVTLNEYAKTLLEHGHTEDARQVLEFAVAIDTDYTDSFLTLGKLYQTQGNATQLQNLLPKAEHFDLFRRKRLTDQLNELLSLCS